MTTIAWAWKVGQPQEQTTMKANDQEYQDSKTSDKWMRWQPQTILKNFKRVGNKRAQSQQAQSGRLNKFWRWFELKFRKWMTSEGEIHLFIGKKTLRMPNNMTVGLSWAAMCHEKKKKQTKKWVIRFLAQKRDENRMRGSWWGIFWPTPYLLFQKAPTHQKWKTRLDQRGHTPWPKADE